MEQYLDVDFDCVEISVKYNICNKFCSDIDNQVKEKNKQLLPEIRELYERYIDELATYYDNNSDKNPIRNDNFFELE